MHKVSFTLMKMYKIYINLKGHNQILSKLKYSILFTRIYSYLPREEKVYFLLILSVQIQMEKIRNEIT